MIFNEKDLLKLYEYENNKPILVDVGSHHGSFLRPFAQKEWQIIAFEPEKNNYEALKRNFASYNNIIYIQKAVSNKSGIKLPFFVSNEHFGIHSLKPFHSTHQFAYEVETVRLDDILENLKISEITLLKIDIEGADFLALKSIDLKKYHPEIIMSEFMDERSLPYFSYNHHDIVTYMKQFGYVAFISEWAPIKEYARKGVIGEPHTWLQCVSYPLGHEPAWGNLIFVRDRDKEKFQSALDSYIQSLFYKEKIFKLINIIKKTPVISNYYQLLVKIKRRMYGSK